MSQPNVLLNNVFTNFLLGALILWVLSLFLANAAVRLVDRVEKNLSKQNPMTLLFGSIGFIIGLLIAIIISIITMIIVVLIISIRMIRDSAISVR
ncbi:hypothetical protein WP50_22720 [Lactiplantibacillus plantarum]|nr:hypothetical protein WP50_22720 [Lactiplantibacillus plantarum]